MANPVLAGDSPFAHDENVVEFDYLATIGATGAITSTQRSKGIKSIVRNSAGQYTLTLDGSYPGKLLAGSCGGVYGTRTTVDGVDGQVTTDSSSATTPTVVIVFYPTGSQTATDVKSGNQMWIYLRAKNGIV